MTDEIIDPEHPGQHFDQVTGNWVADTEEETGEDVADDPDDDPEVKAAEQALADAKAAAEARAAAVADAPPAQEAPLRDGSVTPSLVTQALGHISSAVELLNQHLGA